MAPYFDVVANGLEGLVDGENFFDFHAEDVVVEYVITVPNHPRQIVGRDNLVEQYRGYGDMIVQDGASDVYVHHDREKSVVVLEYTIRGRIIHNGKRYLNRFVSVITIKDRKIVRGRDYLDPLAVIEAFGDNAPGTSAD
jgi:ketosteroid isomerase-like protein